MKKPTFSIRSIPKLRFDFKRRTFHRYVYSYLLVFLLPFSIVSFIWYRTSTTSINDQIDLSAKNQLIQVQSIMSGNLSQLDLITKQMTYNSALTEKMATHPYYASEMLKELQRYKLYSSLIEELYMYFYDLPDKIFSSSGQLDLSTFIGRRYDNFVFNEKELRESLKTTVPLILTVPEVAYKDGLGLMSYFVPLTTPEGSPYGSVMYTMKMTDIQRALEKAVNEETGKVFMFDRENRLLAASSPTTIPEFMRRPAAVNALLKETTKKTEDGVFRVTAVQDEDFGITYLAMTDASLALKDVKATQMRSLLLVLFLLGAGVSVVFFISRRQYKPIHELEKLMEQQVGDVAADEELDSLDKIGYQVVTFLKQNKELHQEIRRQTPHAREQVLRKLLVGRFRDEEEIQLLLKAVDVQLFQAGYFVMLVDTKMVTTATSIQNQEFLMSFLDDLSGEDYHAYGSELLSSQAIALLVSMEKNSDPHQIVKEILAKIVLENVVAPAVGVGAVVQELSAVNHSYIEGLAALEYHTISGLPNQILFFNDIKYTKKNEDFSYPTEEQLKLRQSLQQGNYAIAEETINELVQKGIQEQPTIAGMKLYSYYLLNSVVTIGVEIVGQNFFQEAEKTAEFTNIFELQKELLKMSQRICLVVEQNPKNQESQLQKDIFAYLDAHYASQDFSLEKVAEAFEVSVSYLSRFIKKESGVTFSKYIQDRRLEKIKRDLIETGAPIKDIITAAGYYDVSNYTRKFKSIVGMTPGQYREKNR
ncbi:helix-turn-helix domain-containing protein [Enterococcus sp. LJL98]